MSRKDFQDLGTGFAILFGIFLGILSLYSLIQFIDFLIYGELNAGYEGVLCVPLMVLLGILHIATAVPNGRFTLRTSENVTGRRAAYFLIFFPFLLISFILATWTTSFILSLTFGFPLFILGTFAIPYAALIIHRENKVIEHSNLLRVKCWHCMYIFEMHQEEEWVRCPYCGEPNLNPLGDEEAINVEADDDVPVPDVTI